MPGELRRALAGAATLAVVAGALFFQDLGRYPLWDQDEARHAEVACEMASAGGVRRLFLPTLELAPYREKPAGHYWLVALAYALGGVGAGSARAVNATAGLLTVLGLYAYMLSRAGVATALGTGLVAATSVGWFGLARYANLDMTFTALVTAGVLAGLAWLGRPPPRRPPIAPYLAAGAACLVKGPLGLGLVFGPLLLAALFDRQRPALRDLGLIRGLAITAATAGLFYIPAAILDPSYVRAFAATNLRRFGANAPHREPAYYYLLWLPVLFLPWTLLAAPGMLGAARDPGGRRLVLWAVFVLAVLSLARGKLATYVLPALPPLALMTGPCLTRTVLEGPRDREAWAITAGGSVWAMALLLAGGAAPFAAHSYPIPGSGRALLAGAACLWALALALLLWRAELRAVPLAVLGSVLTLYPLGVRFVAPAIAALHSEAAVARRIEPMGPAPVIAFSCHAPSLVFYTRRPVIHTEDPELVRDLFSRDEPIFLLTGRRHFDEIERLLGPRAQLWHATARRRLYGNRPPR